MIERAGQWISVRASVVWFLGIVVVVVIALAFTPLLQKVDPVVRTIRVAVLYRGRDCIVSRITVFEPEKWRDAVTEFYVIEGGVDYDRPIPPKCKVEVLK